MPLTDLDVAIRRQDEITPVPRVSCRYASPRLIRVIEPTLQCPPRNYAHGPSSRSIFSSPPGFQITKSLRQVPGMPKISAEDTTLTVTNRQGEKVVFPVPKGTKIIIDAPGVHNNRKWFVYSVPFVHFLPKASNFVCRL